MNPVITTIDIVDNLFNKNFGNISNIILNSKGIKKFDFNFYNNLYSCEFIEDITNKFKHWQLYSDILIKSERDINNLNLNSYSSLTHSKNYKKHINYFLSDYDIYNRQNFNQYLNYEIYITKNNQNIINNTTNKDTLVDNYFEKHNKLLNFTSSIHG